MIPKEFEAYIAEETSSGEIRRRIKTVPMDFLPSGEVLIRVVYSSLNYKDALSATGHRGVTRKYPHIPGIDAAGVVVESAVDTFRPGEEVLVTGYDLGMNTPGGYGAYIRVPARWVVKRPESLTLKEAMILGTAGFTAAQSVFYLQEHGVEPDSGDVLVTGATGGVGSLAVSILGRLGYSVTAATGKLQEAGFLKSLGATDVISREDVTDTSGKPLLKGRWAGVVDTVGGTILSTAIRSVRHRGTVTCCGLVASPELSVTVFPFILRGVRLLGVDSAECPYDLRLKIWRLLSGEWKPNTLEQLCIEITWAELDEWIAKILNGAIRGRVIVKPISGVD